MKKYFGKYNSSSEIVADLDNEVLSKPYVALMSAGTLDYNTQVPTPPVDYSTEYLTMEFVEDGVLAVTNQDFATDGCKLMYSVNGGEWTETDVEASSYEVYVSNGDIVRWKVTGYNLAESDLAPTAAIFNDYSAAYNVYGNILSLVYGDSFSGYTTLPSVVPIGMFKSLFSNTGVRSAENLILPTNTITGCYDGMFAGCTGLTVAPELNFSVAADEACKDMFKGCTSLTYIKCLATAAEGSPFCGAESPFEGWVDGVAATGTFVKSENATEWEYGVGGLPVGWTIVDA